MILLLNYLPWLITLLGTYMVYRGITKNRGNFNKQVISVIERSFVIVCLLIILAGLTAGYIPKGTVAPLSNPAFDTTDAEVQDRLRKPERNSKESAEHLQELSDWRKHNAEREQSKQGEQQ